MDFSQALIELKKGCKITRDGWNGKGMWIVLMPALFVPDDLVNTRTRKFVPTGPLDSQPYIVMLTAQGKWQPGWLASQNDILADDWFVVGVESSPVIDVIEDPQPQS